MNLNNQIDWNDTDRIVSNDKRYVSLNGDWWRESSTWQTRQNGSSELTRVGLIRIRLTGHDGRVRTPSAPQGILTGETRSFDPLGNETTIAYDSVGRISAMSVPSGQSNIQNNRTIEHFSWTYLPNSDLKASLLYPNGLTASWQYDANSQILQVRNATPTNVISQFDYTYDAAGRRTAIAKSDTAFGDLSGSIDAYTYNARSELTSARRTKNGQPIPGFSEDFDYDPIGNRRSSANYNEKGEAQTSTYQANNLNQYTTRIAPGYAAVRGEADPNATVTVNENPTFRLGSYYFGSDLFDNSTAGGLATLQTYATLAQTAANGDEAEDLVSTETNQVYIAKSPETFEYDDDGNQTLITTKTGLWRVTYNGENRPILWVCDSDNTTLAMTYDHMGRRREKNDQRFFYDGFVQIANHHSTTTTSNYNYFVWDCTESLATRPLVWRNSALDTSHSALYYAHDGNKNVSEIVGTNGNEESHYEYTLGGAIVVLRGNNSSENPWRYSSEYSDDFCGMIYYNYRHYEPFCGRWLCPDPFVESGENLYVWCSNSNLNHLDSLGLKCVKTGGAGLSESLEGAVYGGLGVSGAITLSGMIYDCCCAGKLDRSHTAYDVSLSVTASFGVGIGGKVKIPFLGEVSAQIKGPQITWTFPSVSFSKDCDDTNPSWVVTLGGVSGDIGGTMSIGVGPGITVGYWSRYTLQVDVEFADNSLAVVRHGWISGGVLNVDFGVVNLDGEFARFDFTKELK